MAFITSKKVGGLRFIRVGRLSLSFCVVRNAPAPKRSKSRALTIIEPRLRSVVLPGGRRAFVTA
jgi:hypothetical protein